MWRSSAALEWPGLPALWTCVIHVEVVSGHTALSQVFLWFILQDRISFGDEFRDRNAFSSLFGGSWVSRWSCFYSITNIVTGALLARDCFAVYRLTRWEVRLLHRDFRDECTDYEVLLWVNRLHLLTALMDSIGVRLVAPKAWIGARLSALLNVGLDLCVQFVGQFKGIRRFWLYLLALELIYLVLKFSVSLDQCVLKTCCGSYNLWKL